MPRSSGAFFQRLGEEAFMDHFYRLILCSYITDPFATPPLRHNNT